MAKKSAAKRAAKRSKADTGAAAATPAGASRWAFVIGVVCLAWAATMSLALVTEHISGWSLPGCGQGSPCEQAANSVWGKVPLINWPVSFLGLAYFLGMLAAWIAGRGALPPALRYLARLGALGS